MIDNALVEKIRKLLALADKDSNDSMAQAEMALKKATELAILHNIDLATIQIHENKKSNEEITKDEVNLGARKSICQKFVSSILLNHFNVKIINTGNRTQGQSMVILGLPKDIQIATYVHSFLTTEFMRLWHKYRKENSYIQTSDRNSYFWGLYSGLDTKLTEQREATEKNAFSEMDKTEGWEVTTKIQSCYALAKVDHSANLNKAVQKFFPRVTKAKSYVRHVHSPGAQIAGFFDGQKIDIRPAVNGSTSSNLIGR
jgi:hypothetical protein